MICSFRPQDPFDSRALLIGNDVSEINKKEFKLLKLSVEIWQTIYSYIYILLFIFSFWDFKGKFGVKYAKHFLNNNISEKIWNYKSQYNGTPNNCMSRVDSQPIWSQ